MFPEKSYFKLMALVLVSRVSRRIKRLKKKKKQQQQAGKEISIRSLKKKLPKRRRRTNKSWTNFYVSKKVKVF